MSTCVPGQVPFKNTYIPGSYLFWPAQVTILGARDESEREEWMDAIASVIRKVGRHGGPKNYYSVVVQCRTATQTVALDATLFC